jgi:hypothetical protein
VVPGQKESGGIGVHFRYWKFYSVVKSFFYFVLYRHSLGSFYFIVLCGGSLPLFFYVPGCQGESGALWNGQVLRIR